MNMLKHRWLAATASPTLLFLIVITAMSSARAAEPVKLTLPQVIQTAQQENKALQAARYALDIAQARLVQAGQYPNPQVEIAGSHDFLFRNEGEYGGSVVLSQEFPITGRIFHQQEVARVDLVLAQAEIDEAERRLAAEVAANFYRLVVLERQIAARTQLIDAEQKLAKVTQARLRAAEVSELDVNTIQLDLRRLQQERARLLNEQLTVTASLNQQLGRAMATPLVIEAARPDIEPLPDQQQAQVQALERRPDLRLAMLEADRANAETALAQSQRWADWTVGVGVQQDRLVIDGAPPQGSSRALALSLSIPLPLRHQNQGAIAEAEAHGRQANARIEALKLTIATEVASAYAELLRLAELLRQYQDNLQAIGERNVQLAQRGYAQGLVSILEVTQALRQQGELNVAYLDTLDQYLQALVRLHTAVADYRVPAASTPVQNATGRQ